MKVYLVLFILVVFTISCSEDGITDPDEVTNDIPILELVQLEGSIEKLATVSSSSIDFGDISATKSQHYLLVNRGSRDAIDVNFKSDGVIVSPNHIDRLLGEGSGQIEAQPIISFTAVHVIPPTGSGSPEPFQIGSFSDSIHLDYGYVSVDGDTNTISNTYVVAGTKLGAIINCFFSGKRVAELFNGTAEDWTAWYQYEISRFFGGIEQDWIDTVMIQNHGNVALRIATVPRVFLDEITVLDTVILPNESIDLSGYLNNEQSCMDTSCGDLLVLGDAVGQSSIFTFEDILCMDGIAGFTFDINGNKDSLSGYIQ